MLIPKIIHYCWFGGKEIPEEYQQYIKEWQSLHEGWEIKKWDESNVPIDLPYVQNALKEGKWANLSNFIRYYTLVNYGGVYMDTDVKVIKPLDSLLEHECFMGFEEGNYNDNNFWVNNAIVGATKNNNFIASCYQYLLNNYDGLEAANLSGPQLVTKQLKDICGLNSYGFQTINRVTLYPTSYFYPIHYNEAYKLGELERYIDETTIAVHVWSRSWLSTEQLLDMYDDLQYKYQQVLEKLKEYQAFGENYKELLNEVTTSQNVNPFIKLQDEQKQVALVQRELASQIKAFFIESGNNIRNLNEQTSQIKQQLIDDREVIKEVLGKVETLLLEKANLKALQHEIEDNKKSIKWYQQTYENRTLWGIIKDRLYKPFKK